MAKSENYKYDFFVELLINYKNMSETNLNKFRLLTKMFIFRTKILCFDYNYHL